MNFFKSGSGVSEARQKERAAVKDGRKGMVVCCERDLFSSRACDTGPRGQKGDLAASPPGMRRRERREDEERGGVLCVCGSLSLEEELEATYCDAAPAASWGVWAIAELSSSSLFFVLFCFYGVSLPGLLVISSAALIASVLRECRPSSCGCPHVAHAPFFLSLCTSRLLRGLERVVVNNTCRLFVLAFFFLEREGGERLLVCAYMWY